MTVREEPRWPRGSESAADNIAKENEQGGREERMSERCQKDNAEEGGQSRKDKGTDKQMGKQGERRVMKQQRKL